MSFYLFVYVFLCVFLYIINTIQENFFLIWVSCHKVHSLKWKNYVPVRVSNPILQQRHWPLKEDHLMYVIFSLSQMTVLMKRKTTCFIRQCNIHCKYHDDVVWLTQKIVSVIIQYSTDVYISHWFNNIWTLLQYWVLILHQ